MECEFVSVRYDNIESVACNMDRWMDVLGDIIWREYHV